MSTLVIVCKSFVDLELIRVVVLGFEAIIVLMVALLSCSSESSLDGSVPLVSLLPIVPVMSLSAVLPVVVLYPSLASSSSSFSSSSTSPTSAPLSASTSASPSSLPLTEVGIQVLVGLGLKV